VRGISSKLIAAETLPPPRKRPDPREVTFAILLVELQRYALTLSPKIAYARVEFYSETCTGGLEPTKFTIPTPVSPRLLREHKWHLAKLQTTPLKHRGCMLAMLGVLFEEQRHLTAKELEKRLANHPVFPAYGKSSIEKAAAMLIRFGLLEKGLSRFKGYRLAYISGVDSERLWELTGRGENPSG
jgi:hypothetical protein